MRVGVPCCIGRFTALQRWCRCWAGPAYPISGRARFYSLPPIWPEGAGYDALLLQWHAYFAFARLGLVALHIGVAIQDYMTDRRLDRIDHLLGA